MFSHKILFNNNAIFECKFQNLVSLNFIRSYNKNVYLILINNYIIMYYISIIMIIIIN